MDCLLSLRAGPVCGGRACSARCPVAGLWSGRCQCHETSARIGSTGPAQYLHHDQNRLLPRPTTKTGERSVSDPGPHGNSGAAPLIEIEGLTKRFGTFTAVDNVSFTVGRGE